MTSEANLGTVSLAGPRTELLLSHVPSHDRAAPGDRRAGCAFINARTGMMPGYADRNILAGDSRFEVAPMAGAGVVPMPSIRGHLAGAAGTNPEDLKFIDSEPKEFEAS